MILTPRGDGIDLKTLGGEQGQGARKVIRKSKGKTPSLSEYLGSFAELLKALSPPHASRSILSKSREGNTLGGKETVTTGADSFLQEKGRLVSTKQQLLSAEGRNHSPDSLKARSLGLEKTHRDSSSFLEKKEGGKELPPEGRGQTIPHRKTTVKWMKEQPTKNNTYPNPALMTPYPREEGKSQAIRRTLSGGKTLSSEETKTIQGIERLDKLLKAKMVQPTLLETSPALEGEKPNIEPHVPTIQVHVDVSGEFRTFLEEGFIPRGSSGIGRETVLQQLQEKANPQIVQQAQLFLKNQEDGEIRLILKPEQLGEVRIRLHLQDRLIEGQITVENSTVKELFDQNRGELAQAFREQGFEMSQLEVSVGNDPQHRKSEHDPTVSHRIQAAKIEEQVPSVERGWMDAHRLIDYYA